MDIVFDVLRMVFTNHEVIMLLVTIISTMLVWVLKQVIQRLNIKLRADRLKLLGDVIDKSLTFAATKVEDIIRAKGWDSLDSKNATINRAFPALEEKFADTLRMNGIDLDDPASRELVRDQMERMIPAVFKKLSESPATPPVPPEQLAAPIVVVPAIDPETTRLNREELARHLG